MTKLASIPVTSPSSGEHIETLESDSSETIERKLTLMSNIDFRGRRHLSVAARIEILEKLLAIMIENKVELAFTISLEGGKPLQDALVEAERAAFCVKLAIAYLFNTGSHTHPIDTAASSAHHQITVNHQPLGPVVAVSAFNHPLNLVTHQVVSAFAAGCPCIVKPAIDTPLSCIKLVDMFLEAGAPNGWVDCVLTADNKLAEKLVVDPRFSFFSFIGSANVGWYLRSKLPPGTRCALEHGGVAPAFVDDTADIERSVESLTKGAFYHAGQVCVSTQRIYIHRKVYDEFVEKFALAAKSLVVGDATDMSTQVGPLIRPSEVQRVSQWVDEATTAGAKIITGGSQIGERYYAPTVLADAPQNSKVNSKEIFGPVCSLMLYDSIDQPIKTLNAESFSFHSAIFSNSHSTIQSLYSGLNTGCLMVNEHTAFRHDAMTFAGLKHSGLGAGGMPQSIKHLQVDKLMITKTEFA